MWSPLNTYSCMELLNVSMAYLLVFIVTFNVIVIVKLLCTFHDLLQLHLQCLNFSEVTFVWSITTLNAVNWQTCPQKDKIVWQTEQIHICINGPQYNMLDQNFQSASVRQSLACMIVILASFSSFDTHEQICLMYEASWYCGKTRGAQTYGCQWCC